MGRKSKGRRDPKVLKLPAWHPDHTARNNGRMIYYYDGDGRRLRRSAGKHSTEGDAWGLIEQLRRRGELWRDEAQGAMTIDEFMPTYWRVKQARAKHSTIAKDRSRWAKMQHAFGHLRLREIALPTVQDFLDERRDAGLSVASVNRYQSLISSVLGLAHKRGLIPEHPTRGRLPQRKEHRTRRPRALTEPQLMRLLDAVRAIDATLPDPYLEVAVCLPLFGIRPGCEPGAVLSLTWGQIDFDERAIAVPDTKGGEPERYEFGEDLCELLRRRHAQRRSDTWLFPSKRGARHLTTIRGPLKRAVELAGLPADVTWYTLRHTCGTLHGDRGRPLHIIQRIMGHADPATTAKYLHAHEHFEREAAEDIDQLVASLSGRSRVEIGKKVATGR
jgi:integrase